MALLVGLVSLGVAVWRYWLIRFRNHEARLYGLAALASFGGLLLVLMCIVLMYFDWLFGTHASGSPWGPFGIGVLIAIFGNAWLFRNHPRGLEDLPALLFEGGWITWLFRGREVGGNSRTDSWFDSDDGGD